MSKENNQIFSAVVPETLVLKVTIGKGISKGDALRLLGLIIDDIGQDQTHIGNAQVNYYAVAETKEERNIESDIAWAYKSDDDYYCSLEIEEAIA